MSNKERKRIDRKGKTFLKAAYPETDASEVTSIKIFEGLIDENRVKTHILRRDKYPNTDGYVEPVDESNRSVGWIHVQLKTLSEADLKRGGYSSDEGFLGHCKDALAPSILVGVYIPSKRADWCEVTRQMVNNMEKAGTLTVKFPEGNVISEEHQDFYTAWTDILERRKRAFNLLYPLVDDIQMIQLAKDLLKEGLTGLPVEEGVNVEKVQVFLDEYNKLMTGEFAILRGLFFPNARRFGLAYSDYDQSTVGFALYEIERQGTDVDIKKLTEASARALAEKGLPFHFYFSENPIEVNPKKLARTIVEKDIVKVVKKDGLPFVDLALTRELVFDLLDKTHAKFGLEKKDVYAIDEIAHGLYEFLPRWIVNFLDMCPDQILQALHRTLQANQFFDIGFAEFGIPKSVLNKVYERTQHDVTSGIPVSVDVPVGCSGFPISLLPQSLDLLRQENIEEVNRLYPGYDFKRNPNARWIYDWLSAADLLKKLKTFYSQFPSSYDNVTTAIFPLLVDDIKYTRSYNRQVVILTAADLYVDLRQLPGLLVFNLKCIDEDHDILIEVYSNDDTNAPQIDFSDHDKEIILDGKKYQLVSGSISGVDRFFQPLPLYGAIRERLAKELNDLFERWEGN